MGDISNVPIDYEDEEIKTALEEQGIVEARRIRRKNEGRGEDIRTNMLQLTFKGELGQKLTDRVKLGFVSHPVRPFYRSIYKCKKCYRLGHLQIFCKSHPWSAPAWMKSNNEFYGQGYILGEYYQIWADYFASLFIFPTSDV
ncbi:Glucosylceramidase-like protein [Daphnia magna]|uniref:Glucosylceramidase n=1 Tax=Daphnia magna TaxID=35525 RepID=A0A164QVH6_9CRUS|nr:Glucosylceramidase-like protein [Daphnia magna]